MARINIVVPPLHRTLFTGGILCIMQYAKGLVARGHAVNVVPILPSDRPQWIEGNLGNVLAETTGQKVRRISSALLDTARAVPAGLKSQRGRKALHGLSCAFGWLAPAAWPYEVRRGLQLRYAAQAMPNADITLATSYETALPVHLFGTGRKFYFGQHYEPYFSIDAEMPALAEQDARASYKLDLHLIANSSWLRGMLQAERPDAPVELCPNAIDHSIFHGEPRQPAGKPGEIRIISYGGRNARWKGFEEMARGVALARERLRGTKLRWLVYGTALLPPDNVIASYEALGFLQPPQLAAAYRNADILLSASWYESFPLFPVEAMACGLPVITTQFGTEEFAFHGETAQIVQPKDPESIGNAIVQLVEDAAYRERMAAAGNRMAREFTWDASVKRMEAILVS